MRRLAPWIGLLLLIAVGFAVRAWFKSSDDPPPPAAASADDRTQAAAEPKPQVLVVEIVERNIDSFPRPLPDVGPDRPEPPSLEVAADRVLVPRALLDELDADKLRRRRIVPGSPGTSIAKARLLVVYRTEYAGVGRHGDELTHYLFSEFPATIPVRSPREGDGFEFKFGRDGTFPIAVRNIRSLPGAASSIVFQPPQADGSVSFSFAGETHFAAIGKPYLGPNTTRAVRVVELPITAVPFQSQAGAVPVEIMPRVDHGLVKFTTGLTAAVRGPLPLVIRQ